jgi:NADPH:quinone reductase-like Zn-dependent oxidoreductase
MQAIVRRHYGSPDVLRTEEIERPTPGDNEVLIKVRAASVNPLDWHLIRGMPYGFRFTSGLRRPKDHRLGMDVSGQVEGLGRTSPGSIQATRFSEPAAAPLPNTPVLPIRL